jgi:membrane protein DedA with SNARE-associated domain
VGRSVLIDISLLNFIVSYGYWAVFLIVMLESSGVPLPGETVLIAAAIYAGTTDELDIGAIVLVAGTGAAIGDSIGYWIGRRFGFPILVRVGPYIGLGEPRLKLGQYLFQRYGGGIVFFGRFVATLRMFAALLAGLNQFPWNRFLLFNVSGGFLWAATFGFGGYLFGEVLHQMAAPFAILLLTLAIVAVVLAALTIRKYEKELQAEAEAAFPGPLRGGMTGPKSAS